MVNKTNCWWDMYRNYCSIPDTVFNNLTKGKVGQGDIARWPGAACPPEEEGYLFRLLNQRNTPNAAAPMPNSTREPGSGTGVGGCFLGGKATGGFARASRGGGPADICAGDPAENWAGGPATISRGGSAPWRRGTALSTFSSVGGASTWGGGADSE